MPEENLYKVKLYIETDSTLPKPRKRRYGYVLEYQTGSGRTVTREGFGQAEGTYHQIILQAMAEAAGRLINPCRLHIHTRNSFVLDMIDHNLVLWASQDFLTAKGSPVANRIEWRALWTKIKGHEVLTCRGSHSYSGWIRAELKKQEDKDV